MHPDHTLAHLAGPEKPAPPDFHHAANNETLAELAQAHCVDNIIWRKLGGGYDGPGGQEMLYRIGQTMLLERLGREITAALASGGTNACVVKGPVFANKLYTMSGDRLYTDIDFLVEESALGNAIGTMRELGYVRADGRQDTRQRSMEYKFTHPGHSNVLIELHGNMVHYPLLRRRTSFGYRELLQAGDGDGEAMAALLATAIVHATLGHKFERLAMLVDVLQAARRLPPTDYRRFAGMLSAMHLGLECAICLGVTARLFEDAACAELASLFPANLKSHTGQWLVTPQAVIGAQEKSANTSWLRRKSFRLIQYLP